MVDLRLTKTTISQNGSIRAITPHLIMAPPCFPTRRASLFSLLALLIITGFLLSTPYLIFPYSLVPALICLSCRLRHRSTTPQPLSTEGTNVTLYCPKCPRSSLTYVIPRGHVISSRSASGELMQKSAVSRSRLLTLVRIQR
jgi:hypothetical protein